jgi:hypothetical protein
VIVDALTGDVLEAVPVVSASRYHDNERRFGPVVRPPASIGRGPGGARVITAPDFDDEPTGSVPRNPPRVITAPAAASPVTRTPLPRPRPIINLAGTTTNETPAAAPESPSNAEAAKPEAAKSDSVKPEPAKPAGKGSFPPVMPPL